MDKMLALYVFAAVLTSSYATPPKTCCFPETWQATMGVHGGIPTGGVPDVYEEDFRWAYDYPNRRWGVFKRNVYTTNDYAELVYIEDFKTRQKMQATGFSNIVLDMESSLVDMRPMCTPEDSVITDRARVGVGEESYTYNAYEWDFQYPENKTAHFKALFLDDCTPISELAWFRDIEWNYTSYMTFLDFSGLDERWNPFQQYDQYYKHTRSYRVEWPDIEDDAYRPWHHDQLFHIMKRIHIRQHIEKEEEEATEAEEAEEMDEIEAEEDEREEELNEVEEEVQTIKV